MAKETPKMECPRCEGSGIYAGYGVCYRCHGKGIVAKRAARKPQVAHVETAEEREARKARNPELFEAAENYDWSKWD